MNFSNLLELYSLKGSTILFKQVENKELTSFAENIESYRQEIHNRYENDEHLLEILNLLRKVFFKLLGSFLPYSSMIRNETKEELLRSFYQIKDGYPELFSSVIVHTAKSFKQISESKENSMNEELQRYIRDIFKTESIAIVTKRAITVEEKTIIRNVNKSVYNIQFFTENSFRKEIGIFDKVVYIGNPNYFGEYVKNTFKGIEIVFFSYDMFTNSLNPKRFFDELYESEVYSTVFNNITISKPIQRKVTLQLEEKELLDIAVNKFIEEQEVSGKYTQDNVEACIVYLENNRFLFVPRDSKIRIFIPDEKHTFIQQVSFKDIEEDDFIIIRNERDTKLIAEVANQILESKAEHYRMLQNEWKVRLREIVQKNGLSNTSKMLSEKYYLKTASIASIRSWCGEDSICPTELSKLLRALNYDDTTIKEIHSSMREIRSAHLKAGRLITDKLMSEISIDFVKELQEQGFYNFTSKEFDGASFNIERIVSIKDSRYTIASYNLMKPIEID